MDIGRPEVQRALDTGFLAGEGFFHEPAQGGHPANLHVARLGHCPAQQIEVHVLKGFRACLGRGLAGGNCLVRHGNESIPFVPINSNFCRNLVVFRPKNILVGMKTDPKIKPEPSNKSSRQRERERIARLRQTIQDPDSIEAIRANNLRLICDQFGTASALSSKLGYANPSRINHIAGDKPYRPMGEKTARQFENKLGLCPQWMDTKRTALDVDPWTVRPALHTLAQERSVQPSADVSWTMDIVKRCVKLLDENSLQLSSAKFADLLELALVASTKNNGHFDTVYMQQILRLMR